MFSASLISTGVPEGVPTGTVVDVISATDADYGLNAVLTYSKTSGDPDGNGTIVKGIQAIFMYISRSFQYP